MYNTTVKVPLTTGEARIVRFALNEYQNKRKGLLKRVKDAFTKDAYVLALEVADRVDTRLRDSFPD